MRNSTGGIARKWTAYTVSGHCGWVPLGINILWLEIRLSLRVEICQIRFKELGMRVSEEAKKTLFARASGWKLSAWLVSIRGLPGKGTSNGNQPKDPQSLTS